MRPPLRQNHRNQLVPRLAMLVIVILVLALISFSVGDKVIAAAKWQKHIFTTLNASEHLLSGLKDAETGQRGYLLTGDANYLEPYRQAQHEIPVLLSQLRQQTTDNPAQQQRLNTIGSLIDTKLAELAQTIDLHRHNHPAEALAIVRSNTGNSSMITIRATMEQFNDAERKELVYRESEFANAMWRTIVFICTLCVVMTVVCFVLILLERQRRELLKLSRSEQEKITALLRNASDGLHILDMQGNVLEASDSFCTMLDYRRDEVIGMNVRQWEAQIRPAELSQTIRKHYDDHQHTVFETLHRRRNGTVFPVEVTGYGLRMNDQAAMFYSARDITERKRQDQELRKFKAIVQSTDDAIASKNLKGVIDSWNSGAQKIFGYDEDEVLGKYIDMLIPTDRIGEEAQLMARVAQGESIAQYDSVRIGKFGRLIDVALTHSPIYDERGQVVGTTTIARDITQKKRAEAALLADQLSLQYMFEHIPVAVRIASKTTSKVIFANENYCELIDESMQQTLQINPEKLYADKADYNQILAQIDSGQNVANRLVQLTIKGNIKWALASYMSMHFKNEPAVLGWLYDITERKKLADEEHYQALFDPLTKLPNRRMLGDRLTLAMQAGKRSHHIGALMFLDMDNFKPLNDQHGHAVGDMLLVEVARRINLCVREVDTVARFGGDEFVVVLSELTTDQAQSADYAMMIAEKIRAQLAAPYRFTVGTDAAAPVSIEHSCSVSIGVTLFSGTDITIEAMLKQADTAMYQAKMSGRNAIRRFEP